MKKHLFALCSLALLSSPSFADGYNGAFGQTWGMTEQEVRDTGTDLRPEPGSTSAIKLFRSNNPPLSTNYADFYQIRFTDKGLQKITMVSPIITNDRYAKKGKKLYREIKKILTKQYGMPTMESETSGLSVWKEEDEFYLCMMNFGVSEESAKEKSCGYWGAFYDVETTELGVELKGIKIDSGLVLLHYEGPHWMSYLKS